MNDEDLELKSFFDTIVENVKRERKALKISQLKLATLLGHQSCGYIAKIELRKDGANYNLATLYKIAKEFNISICKLIPSETDALIDSLENKMD